MTTAPQKNQVARQFGQSLFTKIVMTLLRLTRNAILARALGPADRGFFSLICSLPEMIMTAGNCGLATSAVYQVANSKEEEKTLFGTINVTLLVLSILLIFVSLIVVNQDWIVKDQVDKVLEYKWYIATATVLLLSKTVNINLLTVLNRITSANVFFLMESLLPLLLFLFLWLGVKMDALLAATYSWIGSLTLIAIFSRLRLKHSFSLRFNPSIQRDIFSYGWRGYFDTLFSKLLLRIDFIFISAMIDTKALGYYAMATAAAELLLNIPNSLALPLFSFFMKKGDKKKDETIAKVLRFLLCAMVVVSVVFACVGKILIILLFGFAYLPAYEPLLLLLPGIVAISYISPVRLTLLGNNRPGTISVISGLALLINIVLNLILLPSLGINGVAIAASIAYCFGAASLLYVYISSNGLRLQETLLLNKNDMQFMLNEMKKIRRRI